MQQLRLTRKGKRTLAPLVDAFVHERRVRGEYNARTARGVNYILHDFATDFGGKALNRLTVGAVDHWFEGMPHIAPTTRRIRLSAVSLFCRWLYATRRIKADPMVGYPGVKLPRRVPVTVPVADVGKLLALSNDRRMKAIVWLMVGCGCRCVEVSLLDMDDYDSRAETLRVVGKGGHERVLPVPAAVADALEDYLDEIGRTPGPLIRGRLPGGGPGDCYDRLSPTTISNYLTRWFRAAGIKARNYDGKSAHGLRRTAASDVMDRTHDIQLVQAMLGHAKIETTTAYLRPVSLDRLRDGMEGRSYLPAAGG